MRLPIKYYSIKYFIILLFIIFFLVGFFRNSFAVNCADYGTTPYYGGCAFGPIGCDYYYQWCLPFDVSSWNFCSVCGIPGYGDCAYSVVTTMDEPCSYPATSDNGNEVFSLYMTKSACWHPVEDPTLTYCLSFGGYVANWRDVCQPVSCAEHYHYNASNCQCDADCPNVYNCQDGRVWDWDTCSCLCPESLSMEGRCCPFGSSIYGSFCGCRDDVDLNIIVSSVPILSCQAGYTWDNETCRCEKRCFFQ